MDKNRLLDALAQVLENYRRCGVSQVARGSLPESAQLALERLASLSPAELSPAENASPADYSASAEGIVRGPSAESSIRAQVTADAVASGSFAAAAQQTANEQPGKWTLPVLEIAERVQQMEGLDRQIRDCRRCENIVQFRQRTVFGEGTLEPKICFMGEAPGADEDRQGRPFVGKAGQLLTKIIAAMKLTREEVYILNALKCRPPQNRTPVPEEIENCRNFVESQLEVLKPQFIVCLGAVAVRSILQSNLSIGRLRGRFHNYRGARVVVTYHPSYLLRNESAKRLVWEDMKMLMREAGLD